MTRRLRALSLLVLLAAATLAFFLWHDPRTDPGGPASVSLSAAPTATAESPAVSGAATPASEDVFLDVTATHLCAVQSTVYDDPRDLAAAYASPPPYPLPAADVTAMQARLKADAAFSARLSERLSRTCRPSTPAG
jgi:hypothetical protein